MNWILSFFSNEAHIKHLITQLDKASRSVMSVKAKLKDELMELEEFYASKRSTIEERTATAEKLAKILSALN